MDTISYINHSVFPAAMCLLPEKMDTVAARAMLLATGLQESGFRYRHQLGKGPAGGFWGFEESGVNGVNKHPASQNPITVVLRTMGYAVSVPLIQDALDNNDILACCYARLLLFTHPNPLPLRKDISGSWAYYNGLWRPGKPRRETWDAYYATAWGIAEGI